MPMFPRRQDSTVACDIAQAVMDGSNRQHSIAAHDVSAETFGDFLPGKPLVGEDFGRHHADLLQAPSGHLLEGAPAAHRRRGCLRRYFLRVLASLPRAGA